jgi:hypothetical protein
MRAPTLVVGAVVVVTVVILGIVGIGATAPSSGTHHATAQLSDVAEHTRARRAVVPERLPDLDQETPSELAVQTAIVDGRKSYRLGFRSAVRNIGVGPLIVEGARTNPEVPDMRVDQIIERTRGPKGVVPDVGRMRYTISPDHRHWHYLQFDRYEIRRSELRHAGSRDSIVTDRKTGFCLGDRYRATKHALPGAPREPVFTGRCGLENPELMNMREGISVGYGDDYSAFLEGQDLPLDGLPDGRYVLVHRVNANEHLRELSYANNAASVLIDLRWRDEKPYVSVLATCPDTDRCDSRSARRGN